jgi:endonuclease G
MRILLLLLQIYFFGFAGVPNKVPLEPKMSNPIKATQYISDYSVKDHIPLMVYYTIEDEKLQGYGRYNFHVELYNKTAQPSDYNYSGYDRGHMFPSASSNSYTANYESFDMVNMCPQLPGFNRGIWKITEDFERNNCYPLAHVICGVILHGSEKTYNKITIPEYFYKIIYNPTENAMIAFLLQQTTTGNLKSYAVTVDTIERLTGKDFFYQLPYFQQSLLESKIDYNKWNW